MAEAQALGDMSEDEVLDFAGACAEAARRAEVDLLRAAYHWAVIHSADRLDPAESRKPGRLGAGTGEVEDLVLRHVTQRLCFGHDDSQTGTTDTRIPRGPAGAP